MRGDLATFHFRSETSYFLIILAMSAIAFVVARTLYHAKLGIYFRCIRDNERASLAIGVNVLRYKIAAMMISAALTAVAGTFYAQYLLFVDPRTFTSLQLTIQIILFTVVGGVGTTWGPIIGPLLLVPLSETIRAQLAGQLPGLPLIIFGVVLVLVIRFMPGGLVTLPLRLRLGRRLQTSEQQA
jgi:branched-chain amino acid transport system permease protein